MSSDVPSLTLGVVAARYGVKLWQVRRLYERHLLPQAARCGRYRVVAESDLHSIRAALVAAGYLRQCAEGGSVE